MTSQHHDAYPLVAGIDRWRGGWIIASGPANAFGPAIDRPAPAAQLPVELVSVADADSAVEATAQCRVVAVDMPLSLVDHGSRSAELELRQRLGTAARSVFISPTRAAIDAPTQAQASEINRARGGPGISAQAWGLARPTRELRASLQNSDRQPRWFETHPESAFAECNGGPMASKRTARGVGQRLALFRSWSIDIDGLLARAPDRVPVDDVLDALIAHWTAGRVADAAATQIGPSGRDDQGFHHAIFI